MRDGPQSVARRLAVCGNATCKLQMTSTFFPSLQLPLSFCFFGYNLHISLLGLFYFSCLWPLRCPRFSYNLPRLSELTSRTFKATMASDLDQLIEMGFDQERAQIAVSKGGGSK